MANVEDKERRIPRRWYHFGLPLYPVSPSPTSRSKVALASTVYHLEIDLSDVDRAVYEKLDLRLARHPSESMHYLLARAIAYCLFYEEGIAFSRGLSTNDEPAVWVKDPQGNVRL